MSRLYYSYARHALVTALRLARVQPGAVVLLPHFICRDVLASLKAVQATPVFYDIDEDLQISSINRLPSATAVLAVNYFGFPANLRLLQRQLSNQNTIIIEDNAHGWLSSDEYGVPLGTRTSLGITSFRKTIRSFDGAFLEWKDSGILDLQALHQPLEERSDSLPPGYRVRRVVSTIDQYAPLSLMGRARSTLRAMRTLLGRPPIDLHPEDEFELPNTRAIHSSSLTQMSSTNTHLERHRRRQAFQQCQELAAAFGLHHPRLQLTPGTCPLGFPFFVHQGDVQGFQKSVTRNKLGEIVTWPSLPSQSSVPITSPLRDLRLVNFLR